MTSNTRTSPRGEERHSSASSLLTPLRRPEDFSGTWYEIGRIQTAGGAIFQQNCVCTQVLVGQFDNAGDGNVTYSCREYTTKGSFLNFTGQLTEVRACCCVCGCV